MASSQLWTTGPAHVFVQNYTGKDDSDNVFPLGSVLYLGTCETSPSIRTFTVSEPVYSDTRGPRLPDDWLLAGEHAMTRLDLTKWIESTYASIAKKGTKPRGSLAKADIGKMMRRQGLTFILTVLFPFASQNAYRGMPKGYKFIQSAVEEEVFDPVGTQARKLGLVIHSIYDTKEDLELYNEDIEAGALLALTK